MDIYKYWIRGRFFRFSQMFAASIMDSAFDKKYDGFLMKATQEVEADDELLNPTQAIEKELNLPGLDKSDTPTSSTPHDATGGHGAMCKTVIHHLHFQINTTVPNSFIK